MAARRTTPAAGGKKRITFALSAPQAQAVLVTGSFCNWQIDTYPLKMDSKGVWKKVMYLPMGRYEYRFVVDGQWQDDPACSERVSNEHGGQNCVLQIR